MADQLARAAVQAGTFITLLLPPRTFFHRITTIMQHLYHNNQQRSRQGPGKHFWTIQELPITTPFSNQFVGVDAISLNL